MKEKWLIDMLNDYEQKPHISYDERDKLRKAVEAYIDAKPEDPENLKKRRRYYGLPEEG